MKSFSWFPVARTGNQPRAMHWGHECRDPAVASVVRCRNPNAVRPPLFPQPSPMRAAPSPSLGPTSSPLTHRHCSPPSAGPARLTGRARGRAGASPRRAAKCGQFSGASNEPIFAAIGARGAAPRRLQCAIDDECTLTCTFLRFFIQKLCRYWADRASEGRLASNRMQGDKMRVFSRLCARFLGWLPRCLFARKRFLEVCATTFSAHRAGICPHIAGQLIGSRGTRRAQKNRAPRVGRQGMSYATLIPRFFKKNPKKIEERKHKISECPRGCKSRLGRRGPVLNLGFDVRQYVFLKVRAHFNWKGASPSRAF
jgi:hypothetical protein